MNALSLEYFVLYDTIAKNDHCPHYDKAPMLHDHCPHYDKAPMLHDHFPHYDKAPVLHDHCPHYDSGVARTCVMVGHTILTRFYL